MAPARALSSAAFTRYSSQGFIAIPTPHAALERNASFDTSFPNYRHAPLFFAVLVQLRVPSWHVITRPGQYRRRPSCRAARGLLEPNCLTPPRHPRSVMLVQNEISAFRPEADMARRSTRYTTTASAQIGCAPSVELAVWYANGISALVLEMLILGTVTNAPVAIIRALHIARATSSCGQTLNPSGMSFRLTSRFAFQPIRSNALTRSRAKKIEFCPSAKQKRHEILRRKGLFQNLSQRPA